MLNSLALFCLVPAIGVVIFLVVVTEDHVHAHQHHHS
jgi:hypothetical protein